MEAASGSRREWMEASFGWCRGRPSRVLVPSSGQHLTQVGDAGGEELLEEEESARGGEIWHGGERTRRGRRTGADKRRRMTGSKRFLHLAVAYLRNFRLLHELLIRGFPKVVLRVLYSKLG